MRNDTPKSYDYIAGLGAAESPAMTLARKNSEKLGLEKISLSKVEGGILQFLAQSISAQKIVEIGTLTGLSALYLLQNLSENACLWTVEKSPEHAALAGEVLKPYIEKNRCRQLVGDAVQTLKDIISEGPFDMVFIDGNKAAYLSYFEWALANIKPGGLIVADNVFLAGAVWGDGTRQKFNEKQIAAVQTMNANAFSNPHLSSAIIPTNEGLLVCKKLY